MSSHVSVHYKYWLTLVFHFSVFEGPIRECGEVTILLEVWWICQLKSICLMLSDMETKVEAQCLPPRFQCLLLCLTSWMCVHTWLSCVCQMTLVLDCLLVLEFWCNFEKYDSFWFFNSDTGYSITFIMNIRIIFFRLSIF